MISFRFVVGLSAVCCSMLLQADSAIDSLEGPQWKVFPYVKDGKAAFKAEDKVLSLTSDPSGRGIHYFFDRKIVNRPGMKLTISFEYRGQSAGKGKSWLTAGVYLNHDGSYLQKAASFGGFSFAETEMSEWKKFSRTITLPDQAGKDNKTVTDGKFFFSLTKGGTAEIRNLTLEETSAAQ